MIKEDEAAEYARRGIDAPSAGTPPVIAESRWLMATAVAVAVALQFCKPAWLVLGFRWVLPIAWSGLLGALILADSGRIDRRSKGLRILSVSLVTLVALNALGSTITLITESVGEKRLPHPFCPYPLLVFCQDPDMPHFFLDNWNIKHIY